VSDSPFHVPSFINSHRLGAAQCVIVALCGLVMFLDGFDTQAISYIAPVLAKEWGISRGLLGPIFSSALVGLMVGYLLLSPLSDRFGHRRLMLISTTAFGLLTLATVFVTSVPQLVVLRLLTGIALGSVIPSAVAITTEYSPKRLRASFVLVIYCGFSLGFVAAGVAAASLIPGFGWRSLLWVGAVTPLMVAALAYFYLPESIDFLIRIVAERAEIWGILKRLDCSLPAQAPLAFSTDVEERRSAIASLFQSNRAIGTLALWIVYILNLGLFYALQSWLPSILTNLGFPLSTVATTTSLTTVGGIVAAFVVGPAMDLLGPYGSLATLYLAGVVFVALMGFAVHSSTMVLLIAAFLAGLCISGGQKSVIALTAIFYPAPIRSTGVGWALGIGRLGGIGGPLLIGLLLGLKITVTALFFAAAVPMLISAILIGFIGQRYRANSRVAANRGLLQQAE
jgi:AAHS family 4-hydroxybenzoate transporter-like MFS transporter